MAQIKLNDPVASSLQFCYQIQIGQIQNQGLLSILSQVNFPNFSSKDVSSYNSNRQQGLSYSNSFKNMTFSFPFNKNIISSILTLQLSTNSDFEAATKIIFFSYIAWVLELEKKNVNVSDILLLLESLLFISNNFNFEVIQDLFFFAFDAFLETSYTPTDFKTASLFLKNFLIRGGKLLTKADIFLVYFLSCLSPNKAISFSDDIISVLNLISDLVDNYNFIFSSKIAENIIMLISTQLLAFNKPSLKVFGSLSQYTSDQVKVQIIQMISNTLTIAVDHSDFNIEITQQFMSEEYQNLMKDINLILKEKPESQQYCFPKNEIFANGFDLNKNFEKIGVIKNYNELISEDLYDKISTICQALQKQPQIINSIFSFFGAAISKSNKFFSMIAFYIVFYFEIQKWTKLNIQAINYLSLDIIFNRQIICDTDLLDDIFSNDLTKKNIILFNSIRHYALEILINEKESLVSSLINHSIAYPFFIKELLLHFFHFKSALVNLILNSKSVLKPFSLALSNIIYLTFKGFHQTNEIIIIFLQLILSFISNSEVQKAMFENLDFISEYIKLIFIDKLKPFIFKQFENYLAESSDHQQSSIASTISVVIESIQVDLSNDQNVQILIDIINLMYNVVLKRPETNKSDLISFTKLFFVCYSSIFEIFNKIIKNKKNEELFQNIIKFLNLVSPSLVFNIRTKDLIKKSVDILYDSNPPMILFDQFVQIMISHPGFQISKFVHNSEIDSNDLSTVYSFNVKHPLLGLLLFDIFEKTQYYSYVIFIFDKILDSPNNIFLMNSISFDKILFLKYANELMEYESNDAFDKHEKLNDIKKLFTKIASISTSVSVVLSFVSYISQSSFQTKITLLSFMYELLKYSLENQYETIPLHRTGYLKSVTLNIPKRFSYSCWINTKIMIPQYFPVLFSFTNENKFFEVFISLNKIKICVDPNKLRKAIEFNVSIPTNQWVLLTLNVQEIDSQDSYIELFFNENEASSYTVATALLPNGMCKVNFCGTLQQSIDTSYVTEIGPFAIYNDILNNEAITKLMNEEQRFFGRNFKDPLYIFQPYSQGPKQREFSFVSILVLKCRLEILCPLFKFLDTAIANENNEQDLNNNKFLDVIFKIFEIFFYFGSAIEESFTYSRGFGIIEQILLENDPKCLTYDLYLRFVEIYKSLQTEKLKINLLESIILNSQLWVSAPPQELLNIQRHWADVIFSPKSDSFFGIDFIFDKLPLIHFEKFIHSVILNFHDKSDRAIINFRFNNKIQNNFNTKESLNIMLKIMYQLASKDFKIQHFSILISYILHSASPHLIKKITNLLIKINLFSPSPFKQIFSMHKKCLSILNYILKNGYSTISKYALKFILNLHKNKIINDPPFSVHLGVALREIPSKSTNKEYYDFLLAKMKNGTPELFSFCCWFATNLNTGEYEDLLTDLEPSEKFVSYNLWAVWPIFLSMKPNIQESFQKDLICFLASCSKSEWVNTFNTIEVVCNFLKKSSSTPKGIFIRHILKIFQKEEMDFLSYDFKVIQMIFNYLFFKDTRYESISNMFLKSPFAEIRRSYSHSFKDFNIDNLKRKRSHVKRSASFSFKSIDLGDSLLSLLEGPDPEQGKYIFGIRYDSVGNWIDRDIALKLLHFLFHGKSIKAFQYKLVTYFLVLHDNNDTRVYDYGKTILIPNEFREGLQSLIDLVGFKCLQLGYKNLPIFSLLSENYIVNSQNAFDLISNLYYNPNSDEKSISEAIRLYSQSCSKLSQQYLNADIRHYIDSYKTTQFTYFSYILDIETSRAKSWQMLFASLSIPNAPWYSLSLMIKDWCVKRNPIRCFGGCPFLLKIVRKQKFWIPLQKMNFDIKESDYINCQVITNVGPLCANLTITDKEARFALSNNKVKRLSLNAISKVYKIPILHCYSAIEITFTTGASYIINFPNETICSQYFEKLNKFGKTINLPTDEWIKGNISNFEYLIALNSVSGRSFNNITQYPIFPWVLSIYNSNISSSELDFNDSSIYRDFSKPIGAINQTKHRELIERMSKIDDSSLFLYKNSSSTAENVLFLLGRFEPFKSINSSKENILKSIPKYYESILSDLDNNNELIPEFFYSPEFLQNQNHYFKPEDQINNLNNTVELPKWADSPLDFIYKHRKALESNYVSQHLHEWIDLIWGYKQKGIDALDSFNTYDPRLYGNKSTNNKQLLIDHGIVPHQIFTSPHSQKKKLIDEGIQAFKIRTELRNLNFAGVYEEIKNGFKVVAIDENWNKSIINLSRQEGNEFVFDVMKHDFSNSMKIPVKNSRFVCCQDKIVVAASQSSVISSNNTITHLTKRYLCVASDKNWMLTICSDSVIYLFSTDRVDSPCRRLHFYRETPTCACVNSDFHVFVIGTKDGYLSIYPLEKGSTIRTIDLKSYVPRKIVITPAWGFVVTYATKLIDSKLCYSLLVHTINGEFIRSYSLSERVSSLTAMQSKSGFDYIAVASTSGTVHVCEAYTLTFENPTIMMESPIIMLSYSKKMKALIGVTANGIIVCQSVDILVS